MVKENRGKYKVNFHRSKGCYFIILFKTEKYRQRFLSILPYSNAKSTFWLSSVNIVSRVTVLVSVSCKTGTSAFWVRGGDGHHTALLCNSRSYISGYDDVHYTLANTLHSYRNFPTEDLFE